MTRNVLYASKLIEIRSFRAYFSLQKFFEKCCNLSFGDFCSVSAKFAQFRAISQFFGSQFRREKWQKKACYVLPGNLCVNHREK